MLDALGFIVDAIETIWTFLISIITDAIAFLGLAGSAIALPGYLTTYLPGVLGVGMTALAGAAVVKAIFGR